MDSNKNVVRRSSDITRREFGLEVTGVAVVTGGLLANPSIAEAQSATPPAISVPCSVVINGRRHELSLDTRVTLLDLLRERLGLMGTKKGCDHGQCGACTVLVNERRVNSCLTLAAGLDGDKVTTVEGLAVGDELHSMQKAFVEHDGFQCGYCTPGQICSAIAMLEEVRAGVPSTVTPSVSKTGRIELNDDEIRERMAGNICRCGAYPNIVAAVRAVYDGRAL